MKLPPRSVLGKSSRFLCRFLKQGRCETLLHDLHVSTRPLGFTGSNSRCPGGWRAASCAGPEDRHHGASGLLCNDFACRTPPALLRCYRLFNCRNRILRFSRQSERSTRNSSSSAPQALIGPGRRLSNSLRLHTMLERRQSLPWASSYTSVVCYY